MKLNEFNFFFWRASQKLEMDPDLQLVADFYNQINSPTTSDQNRWELETQFRNNPENLIPCFKFIATPSMPQEQIRFIALTIKAIFSIYLSKLSILSTRLYFIY